MNKKMILCALVGVVSLNASGEKRVYLGDMDYAAYYGFPPKVLRVDPQSDKKLSYKSYENEDDFEAILTDRFEKAVKILCANPGVMYTDNDENPDGDSTLRKVFDDFNKWFLSAEDLLREIQNCKSFIRKLELSEKEAGKDRLKAFQGSKEFAQYALKREIKSLISKRKLMSAYINLLGISIRNFLVFSK